MARALKGKEPKAQRPRKAKVLLFGKASAGKTWGSLEWPSVYYIDVEGGATREHYTDKLSAAGGAYFGKEEGSQDFETVIEEVKTLATTQHPYRTVVIDSFTKLYSNEAARAEESIDPKTGKKLGNAFGVDKKEANKPTRRLISWLDRLDMNVVLICHERPLWSDSKQIGETFDGYDKLDYELDLCLQIQKRGEKRVAIVRKSRLIGFPDGSTFDWNYPEFAERYSRDAMESESHAIELATSAQVSMLRGLVENVRVSEETIEKWLTKAGVSEFSEMDTDTIQKCIDHLTSKLSASAA